MLAACQRVSIGWKRSVLPDDHDWKDQVLHRLRLGPCVARIEARQTLLQSDSSAGSCRAVVVNRPTAACELLIEELLSQHTLCPNGLSGTGYHYKDVS